MNTQPWLFAVVQDESRLKRYSDGAKALLIEQPRSDAKARHYVDRLSDASFNIFYDAATLVAIGVGLPNVTAGASAIDLKRGLDRGLKAVVEAVRALSRPIATRNEKVQIAPISAQNDGAIGELSRRLIDKVGGEGVITVEEAEASRRPSRRPEHVVRPRVPLAVLRVTDPERMDCVLQDAPTAVASSCASDLTGAAIPPARRSRRSNYES